MSDQQPTQIGTPEEQSEHRTPAPTPAEHAADFRDRRPDDCVSDR